MGRYLHEELKGRGISRETIGEEFNQIIKSGAQTIIHCAFNSFQNADPALASNLRKENLVFTKKLTQIPHQKFIFISSVDVYPRNSELHNENEVIQENQVEGVYAKSKFECESAVQIGCKNYLILRSSSLLGKYSRPSSLIRILKEENCRLTLSPDSDLNCVLYEDVLGFLRLSVKESLKGVYNTVSSGNILVSDAAKLLKKKVEFGNYSYQVGNVDNRKASLIYPAFKKTSEQIFKQFSRQI